MDSAILPPVPTTLTPIEMFTLAEEFQRDNSNGSETIAAQYQALTALWSRIKTLSTGTFMEQAAVEVDTWVTIVRESHSDTRAYLKLVQICSPLANYIYHTRQIVNITPLVTSDAFRQPFVDKVASSLPPDTNEREKTAVAYVTLVCQSYAGLWVVLDQLLVHPSTRERATNLVNSGLLPVMQLLLGQL